MLKNVIGYVVLLGEVVVCGYEIYMGDMCGLVFVMFVLMLVVDIV